uniref:Actin-related protein 6 n=1 Tax=Plectus sambesii TaxID=2011161 RepID=A0A914W9Q4_9BILA
MANVFVMDNGACTIKAGYATGKEPRQIPNCIIKAKNERKRVYIGDQIDECKDRSSLFFLLPFQKGFLVNWDVEHQVWDHTFGKECLNITCKDTCIVLTEPHCNFLSVKDATDEVLFEDYGFASALRTNASALSAFGYLDANPDERCCLIVDSGYSFTHIAPYCDGRVIKEAVLRISVGGKLLTNQLKEWISYRQLQVMEETYVMNQCKEDVCFVADDFEENMAIARKRGAANNILRHYVLPDFLNVERGYVAMPGDSHDGEQILKLNHERFAVPEILFRPSDVGIDEMGIAEAIAYCIMTKCPEPVRARLFKNIVLTGGNVLFEGFRKRLETEVRSLAPQLYDVRLIQADQPITDAWHGGSKLAQSAKLKDMVVTKADYDEKGGWRICRERFDN